MDRSIVSRIPDLETLTLSLFPGKEPRGSKYFMVGDIDGNTGTSCAVWPTEGRYHEFNGGESGDVVDILRHRLNTDVVGVVKWLEDNGWMSRDAERRPPPAPPPPKEPKRRLLDLAPSDAALPGQNALAEAYRAHRDTNPLPLIKGVPIPVHLYRTMAGEGVLLVVRYPVLGRNDQPDKAVRRWSWDRRSLRWRPGGTANALLPLYRLDALYAKDVRHPVLVLEGESAVEAAANMVAFSDYVATCPVGGSTPAPGTDWKPVAGRRVFVIPDADPPGTPSRAFPRKVIEAATNAGAVDVILVDPEGVFRRLGGEGDVPRGWDVADALEDSPSLDLTELSITLREWRHRGALALPKPRTVVETGKHLTSSSQLLRGSVQDILTKAASGEYSNSSLPGRTSVCSDCGGPTATANAKRCPKCADRLLGG